MRIEKYKIKYPKFNHVDFLYAIDAPTLVYERMFYVMDKFKDSNFENKSLV